MMKSALIFVCLFTYCLSVDIIPCGSNSDCYGDKCCAEFINNDYSSTLYGVKAFTCVNPNEEIYTWESFKYVKCISGANSFCDYCS